MIDGGVIAGYLALAVTRRVDRFVNSRIDSILNALAKRIARKMGMGPAADLKSDPIDPQVHSKIARAVEARSRSDPQFRRDLGTIQNQLDREGGRVLLQQFWNNSVNQAYGGNVVQAHGVSGEVAGRDVHKHIYHTYPEDDDSEMPTWAKIIVVIGYLIALAGAGVFFAALIDPMINASEGARSAGPSERNIGIGFGMGVGGAIIANLGSLAAAISRRRK